MNPRARRDNLLLETIGDEMIIYDRQRKLAHNLNRTAALVWRSCDGLHSVPEIASLLREQVDPVADDDLVMVAIDRLGRSQLLEDHIDRTPEEARKSRREVVRKVGKVGVLTLILPAVTTLLTPTPAQAASGGCGSS
ncbi:PqqD family protein [Aquisphaera insulae]|uniref:PqqD family protein n=1 Tax=Aquisphaera insulae TaxID=2712864 RepID=UPI0013EB2910|nr:PqqD family protein [Aquisphaera insulae]